MLKRVCFFALMFGVLVAENERVARFEGSPSGIAAGCVNVISGTIVNEETDLVIPGIEPLHISRTPFYAPGHFPKKRVRDSWNLSFLERLERELDKTTGRVSFFDLLRRGVQDKNLVIYQGSEGPLKFKNGALDNSGISFFKTPDERQKGQTALKNCVIDQRSPNWITLHCSSGEVRDYTSDTQQHNDSQLLLRSVVRPNGFRHSIQYDRNNEKQGITILSPTAREVSYYGTDDQGDALCVQSFDGRSIQYNFQKMDGDNGSQVRFLKGVDRTDAPSVRYEYATENVHYGQLKKIEYPEGRNILFDYWDKNSLASGKSNSSFLKVKAVFQPVGATSTPIRTHTFDYYTKKEGKGGWTDVIDFENNKDVYLYDNNYRLKEIQHYKGMTEKYFVEKFFWDKEGQLILSALLDGNNNPLRAKRYRYLDGRGNVNEERVFGNLTGGGKALPKIDENGQFNSNGLQSYGSYFDYSADGKNLLVKESHENGLVILYSYLEGTNLISEKVTFANDLGIKNELFIYDSDHRLIESVEDDGERKTIVRYVPLERPFGYPQEKKVFGWSPETGEVFQESYHYTYDVQGHVISEERRDSQGNTLYTIEKAYDAHGNCIWEKNSVGETIRRVFDLNDNCILEEGPRAGLVKGYSFDWMNRCIQETVTYQGKTTKKDFAYNKRGHLVSTVDSLQQASLFTVDRFGNQVQIELPPVIVDGIEQRVVLQQTFDHFGNVLTTTDSLGLTTKTRYTSRNKPYLVEYPDGTVELFRYTLDGQLSQSIDREGVETRYDWDSLGRLQAKQTPLGTEYFYYRGQLLSRSADCLGVQTHYTYDPFGRLSETLSGSRKEVISYDAYGFPCRKSYYEEDRLVKTEVTCYDALKRVVKSHIEDASGAISSVKRFEYDGSGNCIVEWDGLAKTTKAYDGENRVIEVTDPVGNTQQINYLKEGQIIKKNISASSKTTKN